MMKKKEDMQEKNRVKICDDFGLETSSHMREPYQCVTIWGETKTVMFRSFEILSVCHLPFRRRAPIKTSNETARKNEVNDDRQN